MPHPVTTCRKVKVYSRQKRKACLYFPFPPNKPGSMPCSYKALGYQAPCFQGPRCQAHCFQAPRLAVRPLAARRLAARRLAVRPLAARRLAVRPIGWCLGQKWAASLPLGPLQDVKCRQTFASGSLGIWQSGVCCRATVSLWRHYHTSIPSYFHTSTPPRLHT